jgi:hypothetical protein
MDVSRYEPERFGVTNHEELQTLFDKYEWPVVTDLWIPIASAIIIGCLENFTMYMVKEYAKSQLSDDIDKTKRDAKAHNTA